MQAGTRPILATRVPVAQPARMSGHTKRNAQANRRQRLSTALRENLKRRKAQAREREAERRSGSGAAAEDEVEPHDSAGIVGEKRPR
jgi:hypothetical protein